MNKLVFALKSLFVVALACFHCLTSCYGQKSSLYLELSTGYFFTQTTKGSTVYSDDNLEVIPFPSFQVQFGKRYFFNSTIFLQNSINANYLTRKIRTKQAILYQNQGGALSSLDYTSTISYLYAGVGSGIGLTFKKVSFTTLFLSQYRVMVFTKLTATITAQDGQKTNEKIKDINEDLTHRSLRKVDYGLQFKTQYSRSKSVDLGLLYYFGLPSRVNGQNIDDTYSLFNRSNQQYVMLSTSLNF